MRHFRHLTHLVGFMRWRALGVLGLIVGGGLLEGAGLLLLIPLLGSIGLDVQQGAVGRLAAIVTGAFTASGVAPTLPRVLLVFVGVNIGLAWLKRTQATLSGRVEQELVHSTRVRLYQAILRMEWLALSRRRASDFNVSLNTECERAGYAASQVLTIVGTSIVTLVYIGFAWRLSAAMTAGVFVCGAALTLILRRRTKLSELLGAAFSDATRDFQAAVTDDMSGLKTIRGYGAEPRSLERFDRVSRRIGDVRSRNISAYATSTFWLDVGSAVMLSGLVFVAVNGLHFQPSALLMLVFLFARVMPRLAALQQNVQFYLHVLPSAERVHELQLECDSAAEPPASAVMLVPLADAVRLKDVTFTYDAGRPPVLEHLDLTVRAGSIVALVGPSGGGKTTVVDILLALLTPQHGGVEVDGRMLQSGEAARWRNTVAYVPQDAFLFHGTIRENLRWAVPTATDEDLRRALDAAAAGFVEKLPEGLDTVVGDRGAMLSGGERQRLALARALLRRPSLLVLDEATSALDSETEKRVLDVVWRLRGQLTVVLVTHRLHAVREADVIHVLEDGTVVESGSWQELLSRPSGRLRSLLGSAAVEAPSPA